MACQDTGQILKYFAGIMAFLLTHEYVVETLDFTTTSIDFQFYSSGVEGQLHYISAEQLEYIVVVEVNTSHTMVTEQIRAALALTMFPVQLDNSTKITAVNITTVCQPNVTEYQCACEDGYAWTYNNCRTYEACDDISLGSCGCINGIPSDGEMCVLDSELPFTDFLSEIEMESSSIAVIDEMRRYLQNITFPLQLDELVGFLDVDITTVCNFNDSGYKCACEDQYFWPSEKCREYGSCDDITNNTCSCINDIPRDRQFCQPVNEITNNTACAHSTVSPVLIEYRTEIQIDAENTAIIDQLMNYWMSFDFPYTISDCTNITETNITTVCSLNETQYQCKCEGLFVWPNDTCHSYKACDDIIDGSCTCLNDLPFEGQICQLKVPTVTTPSPPSTPPSTPTSSSTPPSSTSTPPSTPPSTSTPSSTPSTSSSTPPSTPSSTSTLGSTPSSTSTPPSTPSSTPPSTPPTPSSPLSTSSSAPPSTPSSTSTLASTPSSSSTPSSTPPSTPSSTPQSTPSSTPLSTPSSTPPSTPSSTSTLASTPSSSSTPSSTPPSTPSSTPQSTPSSTPLSTSSSTPPSTPSSPSTPPPSTQSPTTIAIEMSVTITKSFDTSLTDHNNEKYKILSGQIEKAIDTSYIRKLPGYSPGSAKVSGFRSGSIIADYTISATSNNLDFEAAHALVNESLRAQGLFLVEDAFAQNEQKKFTTDLYPLQKLDLNCIQPDFAKGQIKWTVNNKDPKTGSIISNNNTIFTVKNTSESDSGRYSCIIQGSTVQYIQWQNIVIKQRPTIIVGDDRVFTCNDSVVHLRCSVDAGYNVEWVLNEAVQTSVPASGSDIILNYATKSGNCKEETFTCRLKDLPQLQNYSYSWSRVKVKTSKEEYDCEDVNLGSGNANDETEGICGNGMKGTIKYRCVSRKWTEVKNNCVLDFIDKSKSDVKSLLLVKIPEFMANLSDVTAQNNVTITQSPATVQAIVDILATVANLSQTIGIHKPVMEDFLNTVDIIVSGNVSGTWGKLNNDNNTSIKLLDAIEKISDHLIDDFAINGTSFQLNRITINNTFHVTSTLPNSTTEIIIPQVPNVTTITTIIFTTLDNVLPTRNTSNTNDTNNVRINGDVVVVKVKPTLHNISLTFDITNQSLRNPQCVFWNFSLDAWDSTGCKVKLSMNTTVTCECNHTTSFSILMSPFPLPHKVLAYITYIGVAISMASLILCLIIEIIVWKSMTRNDTSYMRHVSIVNIAVSLLIANICFIIGAAVAEQEQPTSVNRCSPAVFFMHFFYLALFFWMLISALLLFYRTVMVLSQMSRAKMMAIGFIVGYGAPLLIAVITVASTAGPQKYIMKQNACWLNLDESKALLAFVIPALTIVAINLMVLIVVLCKMLRRGVGATTQPDEKHALLVIARCVAILTPIFGLTWGFGIGTMVSRELGIHVVFALLNSLQGFFILVFGTLLDSKVRESLKGKLSLQKLSSNRTQNTSAGSSSTTGFNFLPWIRRRNVYNVSEANVSSAVTSSDSSNSSYALLNT